MFKPTHWLKLNRCIWSIFLCLWAILLFGAGCAVPDRALVQIDPQKSVTIEVDGDLLSIQTTASTVRQLLEDESATLSVSPDDLVSPPRYTPLEAGMTVRVTRLEESIETVERAIPFERRIVRNEAMSSSDDPVIIQPGKNGLEELTLQIVYQDGIEVERRVIQTTIVSEAQEEILMIGLEISSSAEVVRFGGLLAFINGGRAQLFRGSNLFPEELSIDGALDRRVFALSPDGEYLLFTTVDETDSSRFNQLKIIDTSATKTPVDLGISNVLWADWNPVGLDPLEIAYSTGQATTNAPGWEADNNLFTVEISGTIVLSDSLQTIVDGYPATFGWWGGDYAWSPDGAAIAYSFADEVGVIELSDPDPASTDLPEQDSETENGSESEVENVPELVALSISQAERRRQLIQFTEYDTRSDWVWVPSLSWSPNGKYLVFTQHAGDQTTADRFDSYIIDLETSRTGRLLTDSGIWSHLVWSTAGDAPQLGENLLAGDQNIAFLRAVNSRDSLSSSYALWLMDQDGSNKRKLFPPPGITSRFPRDPDFLVWNSLSPGDMIFVFDGDLYWFNLEDESVAQLTNDEPNASQPSWAPYGAAASDR